MHSNWMTIEQAAEYLQLSRETLYKYAQQGTLPAAKVGKHWRFSRAALDQWAHGAASPVKNRGPGAARTRAAAAASGDGRLKVLIVDDDLSVRKLLAVWIAQAGHEAIAAGSGAEALELLRHQQFGLMFLDLYLQDMQGDQLLARIPESERPPVVLITGVPEGEALDAALAHQVVYALTKPFREEDVVRVLTMVRRPLPTA